MSHFKTYNGLEWFVLENIKNVGLVLGVLLPRHMGPSLSRNRDKTLLHCGSTKRARSRGAAGEVEGAVASGEGGAGAAAGGLLCTVPEPAWTRRTRTRPPSPDAPGTTAPPTPPGSVGTETLQCAEPRSPRPAPAQAARPRGALPGPRRPRAEGEIRRERRRAGRGAVMRGAGPPLLPPPAQRPPAARGRTGVRPAPAPLARRPPARRPPLRPGKPPARPGVPPAPAGLPAPAPGPQPYLGKIFSCRRAASGDGARLPL